MKAFKSLVTASIGLGLLVLNTSANAASLVLEAGIHFGGDELARATYTNGSTTTIDAGALFSLGVGVGLDLAPNVESRITFGIKTDDTTASNGDISFTRYPIDVLFLYKTGDWKLGAGITYHLNPKLEGGGVVSGLRADFDDALGVLLEADYDLRIMYLGARVTFIEYESIPTATVRRATIDGNSIGFVAGVRF